MRAVVVKLLLLLCLSEVQPLSTDNEVQPPSATTIQLDISAELKYLREMLLKQGAMLIEQGVTVKSMETRLRDSETKLEDHKTMVVDLKVELSVTKTELQFTKSQLEEVKKENTAMEARMRTSESQVEDVKRKNDALVADMAAMKVRMTASESEVEKLTKENTAQGVELSTTNARLTVSESELEKLKKENAEKPKVAFSAGLTDSGYVGTLTTDITLVYTKVFTNIGKAYSPATGAFTVPVRGVYYFRFTASLPPNSSQSMGIYLYKNEERLMFLHKSDSDGQYDYASNGVTLQLEVGDVVYMRLPSGRKLHDSSDNRNTFSGFLLFTM